MSGHGVVRDHRVEDRAVRGRGVIAAEAAVGASAQRAVLGPGGLAGAHSVRHHEEVRRRARSSAGGRPRPRAGSPTRAGGRSRHTLQPGPVAAARCSRSAGSGSVARPPRRRSSRRPPDRRRRCTGRSASRRSSAGGCRRRPWRGTARTASDSRGRSRAPSPTAARRSGGCGWSASPGRRRRAGSRSAPAAARRVPVGTSGISPPKCLACAASPVPRRRQPRSPRRSRRSAQQPRAARPRENRAPRRDHFAASQSRPIPASTASGGSISNAPAICSQAIRSTSCGLVSGSLEQQLVVDLEDQRGSSARPRSVPDRRCTIATFMMSAAVPWMTMLTAKRSPCLRSSQRRARSSGTCRRRPNSVET